MEENYDPFSDFRIEHIGIAVKDIRQANEIYSALLGVRRYKEEQVDSEKVITSFFRAGEAKIELLEGLDDSSPVKKFIEKRGEGVHHIAFAVEDIEKEMKRLKSLGFHLLNDVPKKGADNKLICFIHPKDAHGVLIELCQEMK